MMSSKEQKQEKIVFKRSASGIREIPSVIRRGMRMNPSQLRFSLTVATLLVFALIFVILFASGRANDITVANEKAQILQEATGAERIEMGKKTIELNQENGTKTIDGKRIVLLQKVGQQKAGNAKTYWLTVCTEADVPAYETGMGKDKKLILLDSKGDQGLYITLAKDTEIEKCRKANEGAFFFQLSKRDGEANLDEIPEEYRAVMAEMMNDIEFINFGYNEDKSIRLTRGTNAEIASAAGRKNTMRFIRIAVIVLLACAAAGWVYGLKATKLAAKGEAARRPVILISGILAAVLIVALVFTTVQVSGLGDNHIRTDELTIDTDVVRGIDFNPDADNSGKYIYSTGAGKTLRTVAVSPLESVPGAAGYRILLYAAIAALAVLAFALIYFFRYERDMGFPIFNTVFLILLMFITLYPVLNTVAYSFNDGTDAARGGIGLLPRKFSTKSYERILKDPDIAQAGLISVSKTIITTILNLFWTGMLAFALSRREYVLRKFITLVMVVTMYVNAGLIPTYLLISKTLGLRDTFWVYIIPTMFYCFNMIVLRTYIMGLPDALVESARIDGAGDIRIYWQIIFPLCAPVLATVALFVAVGAWNSWIDTMLYIPTKRSLDTLQYYLKGKLATAGQTSNLANATTDAAAASAAFSVTQRTVQCATTVVTALPILVIYPFLQKYFVTGMALGSVKG